MERVFSWCLLEETRYVSRSQGKFSSRAEDLVRWSCIPVTLLLGAEEEMLSLFILKILERKYKSSTNFRHSCWRQTGSRQDSSSSYLLPSLPPLCRGWNPRPLYICQVLSTTESRPSLKGNTFLGCPVTTHSNWKRSCLPSPQA